MNDRDFVMRYVRDWETGGDMDAVEFVSLFADVGQHEYMLQPDSGMAWYVAKIGTMCKFLMDAADAERRLAAGKGGDPGRLVRDAVTLARFFRNPGDADDTLREDMPVAFGNALELCASMAGKMLQRVEASRSGKDALESMAPLFGLKDSPPLS